jgi:hypothetical protein
MREIELDLFSLMHPRVVADDDDDGRASILIVFYSLYSFPPFFPSYILSILRSASNLFFSFFFPFHLMPISFIFALVIPKVPLHKLDYWHYTLPLCVCFKGV